MSTASRIAVPLLVIAAIAGAAAFFFLQETPAAPAPPPVTPPPAATTEQPSTPAPVVQAEVPVAPPREIQRDNANAHADAEQGVKGRVVLPDGSPAANVPVYLLENMMNNIFEVFVMQRSGRVIAPVASSVTGADGTFQLGVRRLDKPLDLRIVPESHPEFSRTSIKVREGDWYDTGNVQLEQGLVVQGRVIEAHSKAPIANATVHLTSSQQSQTMVAAPGRERGIPATTDANGAFRFANAPRTGLVTVSAEAAGYANGQVLNQMLKQDSLNEVTIELEHGLPIAGIVVDRDGKPIADATIAAQGLSAKTPQTASTISASDGTFTFPSLRSGPYALTATSTNFAEVKQPLVLTGENEVKLVMSKRGAVKLRVLAANGQPVKAYRLGLKRHFPQNPANIGNTEVADRTINPGDYPREYGGEWALVRNLPSGDFRFQITENNHAKTLSDPFTVVEGEDPIEVECRLTLGGAIVGTVIDDRGQPIANAAVTTDMNGGLAADSELFIMLRGMIPEKHTKQTGRTDAQGKFRIPRLAFADYMIRAAHPDYCEGTAIDIKLESEGQTVDAGVIQLARGAIVEGTTFIGGNPAGQVKVTLSTPMTAETLPGAGKDGTPPPAGAPRTPILFNASVQSAGDGTFKLLKRVPPGTYKATAQRPNSGGDPFGVLFDIKQSEQQIVIAPGQDRVTVTFQLPAR